MKALSVQQPWAHLLAHGIKDIENRTWSTSVRGWVLLHAGKQVDVGALEYLVHRGDLTGVDPLPTGALIGAIRIDDCVAASKSRWFSGPFGFVVGAGCVFRRPLPFRGALGFFNVPAGWDELDSQLAEEIRREAAPSGLTNPIRRGSLSGKNQFFGNDALKPLVGDERVQDKGSAGVDSPMQRAACITGEGAKEAGQVCCPAASGPRRSNELVGPNPTIPSSSPANTESPKP